MTYLNPDIPWEAVCEQFEDGISLQQLEQMYFLNAGCISAGLITLLGHSAYDAIISDRLKRLTEDEKRQILDLFSQGNPLKVIADSVQRSRATCRTAIIAELGEAEYNRLIAPRRRCLPARERMNLR